MGRHTDYFTQNHQFALAQEALQEAENHRRAHWYASSIVHSWQVAHRSAAGLLFSRQAKVFTEKDVRYGLSAQFVGPGLLPATMLTAYDRLDEMRQRAETDPEYTATPQEAEQAYALAHGVWTEISSYLLPNP